MFRTLGMILVAGASFYAHAALAAPSYFTVGDLADPRCAYATIVQAFQSAQLKRPQLDYIMAANDAAYAAQAYALEVHPF